VDLEFGSVLFRMKSLINEWEKELWRFKPTSARYKSTQEKREALKTVLLHDNVDSNLGRDSWLYDVLLDHEKASDHPNLKELEWSMVDQLVNIFAIQTATKLTGNCPFVTTRGDFGRTLDNCEVREGDVLCLFRGGHAPFILRPEGDKFRYMGHCVLLGYNDFEIQPRARLIRIPK
jgi:hypothetical protein